MNLPNTIREAQQSIIADTSARKVGYLCNYTPVELLSAAGVRHFRLIKGGSAKTVSSGELYTQSVFCDFTKSCIGYFQEKDPLYTNLDRVYNFHSCANMKRATEVIETFVPTKLLNLPRLRESQDARNFFRQEILEFKNDLELLTGKKISESAISEQIRIYNQVRRLYRRVSELRKRLHPPISGREFLDLANAYHYLEGKDLIELLEKAYVYYSSRVVTPRAQAPLRILIAGSIVAHGDRRLIDILEDEVGASVVAEDHCSGIRPFHASIPEDGDPYEALANGYLDQAPCARMRPFGDALDFSVQLAREYNAEAVVYVFLKFCTCYGVSKKDFIERYRELGLPVLEISSDYSESDHGQLKTRLEAFGEVLRERQLNKASNEQLARA